MYAFPHPHFRTIIAILIVIELSFSVFFRNSKRSEQWRTTTMDPHTSQDDPEMGPTETTSDDDQAPIVWHFILQADRALLPSQRSQPFGGLWLQPFKSAEREGNHNQGRRNEIGRFRVFKGVHEQSSRGPENRSHRIPLWYASGNGSACIRSGCGSLFAIEFSG